jgi:signal transduction histidine kinase
MSVKSKHAGQPTSSTSRSLARTEDIMAAVEVARAEAETARVEAAATQMRADATAAQLNAIQALTDTALSHHHLDDLLRELLCRVPMVMGIDNIGIFLLDKSGHTLTLRAAHGLLMDHACLEPIALGRGVPGRIAMNRKPLIADAPSAVDFDGASPMLREQIRSLAGVPLLVEDQVADHLESRLVGVLLVGCATPRHFTDADMQLLQRAADRIALAVDRARLYAAEQEARQRAEAALAQAKDSEARAAERAERLNTILETMADGVAVYDAEGRPVQMVNRAYREMLSLDFAPAEYDVKTTMERVRLAHVRHAVTGESLPFAETPIGRALRGEVVTGPSADIRARAFDGRELEVNTSAAPLRDAEGRVTGVVLVLRDITWRRQLEREREEARAQAERQAEQLDRIFEAAADGLIVYDPEGRITRENPAARRILGLDAAPSGFRQLTERERFACYGPRDEQGRPLPPEKSSFMHVLHAETENEGVLDAREVRVRALDGRVIDLNVAARPLHDRGGRLVGAVSVLRDMTEHNQLAREREEARAGELAALEANRRMEAFVAAAAHDLRAPLTATTGYIELAQRQADRLASVAEAAATHLRQHVESVRHRLKDTEQSVARLRRLLALLFDTAAIGAGTLQVHCAPADLAQLAREQVEALRVAVPERAIRLHLPRDAAPVPVELDADRIGQVLTNYVTNALKYSPPEHPVDVTVTIHRRRARVMVCDRGTGIPKGEQSRVWDLFHRAPGAAPRGGTLGGTLGGSLGLGLYICRAIITAHGGRVGVKSSVGRGSTFWFTLPLAGSRSQAESVAA